MASKLEIYGYGVVAANKPLDSDEIEVVDIESNSTVDGELTDNGEIHEATGVGADGQAYKESAGTSNTIKASWLWMGQGNRISAPDVRRGAEVVLYRFADRDAYFWTTRKNDLALRKLETVIYAFSATEVEGAPVNAENYYFLEISSHRKAITLSTSKANGEPYAYTVQINTGEGRVVIQDDIGNSFTLDSVARLIELINADGARLALDRKDITFDAPDNIFGKAGKTIKWEAQEIINDAQTSIVNDGPTILNKGNMATAAGKAGTTGTAQMAGDTRIQGSLTAEQDVTAERTLTGRKLVSIEDIVAPNIP